MSRRRSDKVWDDFSFGGFLAGWRNPHRRWRGRTILWAGLVAAGAVVAIAVVGAVAFEL
jgi:hypothetical protein